MSYDDATFAPDGTDILTWLKDLSAAEEFFDALGVTYDPKVLNTSRLHIMKRMGQYLVAEDFSDLPTGTAATRARAALERAHRDFATSSPLKHRVFKVLEDRDPTKAAAPVQVFVPLEELLQPSEISDCGGVATQRCHQSDKVVAAPDALE
ncbi:nitrogenase stabilizing/protective protein NifW [Sinorhizobium fredii]|uniref:Nitrogenase-stabilizing/protective protein NifW n=1 Tax=Rhizobium fredii TaxID=380 RepID=A0A2A6LN92_RHIFR|nr:nitrogenase stabilizing/protective protein NifW [Sinorhizobium fredii]